MNHCGSDQPWPHDQLTRHLAAAHTSIAIDQNGQAALTGPFHQNIPYPPSSEFDGEDKKPIIDWNEKLWQQNGTSKLSPSDVRTATPSANSTESTPSSQRHSIGPEESDARGIPTPEIKTEISEMSADVPPPTSNGELSTKEASQLLLSLAQPLKSSTTVTSAADQQQLAALRIEEKILHEKLTPQPEPQMPEKTAQSIESVVNSVATAQFDVEKFVPQAVLPQKPPTTPTSHVPSSTTPPRNSRAFFRAPGHLGPAEGSKDNSKAFVCAICNFSCPSKFHYNSHMNTHGDHQCSMCDYTSRTEGRLKKHMRESHTREEQIAAGLDVPPEAPTAHTNTPEFQATMASLMEAAKTAVNNVAAAAAATATESGNNSPVTAMPSALDSLRALSETAPTNLAAVFQLPDTSNDSTEAAGPSTPRDPPKRSSGGKGKKYACKQCSHIATSKEESWRHNKSHIPSDKQLPCPQCEFVTEYKHHLEYHIRNHYGSKPFRCTKCAYSCVNKSMLNSHMKSHSTEYQFQCIDCSYQSKYCHSLKMHLRKYGHRRKPGLNIDDADEAMANDPSLEEEGSVHSAFSDSMQAENNADSRDAPPPVSSAPPVVSEPVLNNIPNNNNNTSNSSVLLQQPLPTTSAMPYANLLRGQDQISVMAAAAARQQHQQNFSCTVCDFTTTQLEQLLHHNVAHIQQNQTASAPTTPLNALLQYLQNSAQHASLPSASPATIGGLSQLSAFHPTSTEILFRAQQTQQQLQQEQTQHQVENDKQYSEDIKMEVDTHHDRHSSPIDSINADSSSPERSSTSPMDSKDINGDVSSVGSTSSSSSRKRKANSSKLEEISQRLQGKNSPEHADDSTPIVAPVPIPAYRQQGFMEIPQTNGHSTYANNCDHCKIGFGDETLYDIHRGYHGYDNPFKCNRCGEVCSSAVAFNLHLWRVKHD